MATQNPATKVRLQLYKNGFRINKEPFRPTDATKENTLFIEQINEGVVPDQLELKYKIKDPEKQLKTVDMRDQDFEKDDFASSKEEEQKQLFVGKGVSLGGATASVNTLEVNLKGGSIKCDKTKGFSTLKIALHNGQTVSVEVNDDEKLLTLMDYVMSVAPCENGFQLLSGMPPKPVVDFQLTLDDLDLTASKFIQKPL